MNISLSIAQAVRWLTAGRILAQLFRWSVTLAVIRILVPEDYGLIALAMTFLNVVSAFYEMGLAPAVIQAKSVDEDDARRIAGVIVLTGIGVYLAFLVSAPWLASLVNEPELIDILRILGLMFPIISIASVPQAIMQRHLDFKRITVLDVTAEICGALATLTSALLGLGVWSLIVGHLTTSAMYAVLMFSFCPVNCLPRFNFRGTRRFIDFGGIIVLQRVISTVYRSADIFILGQVFSTATVGLYTVALEFSSMPLRKITPIVNGIAFAGFSRLQDDQSLIAAYLEKAFRFLSLFGLPVFLGMSSVAPELVAVVLGANWTEAALPLQLLSLVMPLRLLSDPLHEVLNGIGQARLALQNTIIIAATLIIAFLVGVQFGILGMCWAWLIGLPAAFAVNLFRSSPHTGLGIVRTLVVLGPCLLACILMYAVVLSVGRVLPWPQDSVIRLISLIGAGALTYGASMLVLRPNDLFDLWHFLKK